jgi:hypothetical protein
MITTHSVAAGATLRKDRSLIFVAVIAVAVILFSAFLIDLQMQPASTPATKPIQSASNYYLPYNGSVSRIFVVSSDGSYGNYPYPTVTLFNGSVVRKGEPCVIINVTIRNDYTIKYPPPSPQSNNSTVAYVFLTAQIFNGKNQIDAMDVTPPLNLANGGAYASLSTGENSTLTIYLATKNTDITSFQIVTRFIGGFPPP